LGGVVLGAALTKAFGDGKSESMVAGAGLGAFFGGLVGADMDRRRCELAKVTKAHNLDTVMTDITLARSTPVQSAQSVNAPTTSLTSKPESVGMSFTIFDRGNQFVSGSATPSPEAVKAFSDVADKYRVIANGKDASAMQAAKDRTKKMRLLFVGHTDDTGSSETNADLSEERARVIAKIFLQQGFEAGQIFYQGAGEVFPIHDNRTDTGRARNRRVEIVDLSDEASFSAFLAARRPNVAHYRPATQASGSQQIASNIPAPAHKAPDQKNETVSASIKTPTASVGKVANADEIAKAPTVGIAPAVPSMKSAAAPTMPKSKAAVPSNALDNLDFGGKPVNGQYKSIDIGKTARLSTFSIISTAYAADDSPVGSCASDRPRISRSVKSLSSGQGIKTSAYLPGAADASWGGKANGHLVGLAGVSVLRDGGQPASRPTFYVWKDYVEGSKASADFKTTGDVNAYQGDKALLYRVFLTEGPVRCLDVVIPNGSPNRAPSSNIVYERSKTVYQADYSPSIAR
jgi:outer membrane protein OmpA-like peptidoglycan-associated protein